jgi:hypothetical protein
MHISECYSLTWTHISQCCSLTWSLPGRYHTATHSGGFLSPGVCPDDTTPPRILVVFSHLESAWTKPHRHAFWWVSLTWLLPGVFMSYIFRSSLLSHLPSSTPRAASSIRLPLDSVQSYSTLATAIEVLTSCNTPGIGATPHQNAVPQKLVFGVALPDAQWLLPQTWVRPPHNCRCLAHLHSTRLSATSLSMPGALSRPSDLTS